MQRQPDPPGDLKLDDRQADRQADPPPGDEVEEAVPGVVELGRGRRAKAGFAIEDVVKALEDVGLSVADIEPDSDPFGERVEDRQGRRRIDLRAAVGGDEQGAQGEVDFGVGLRDEPGEPRPVGGARAPRRTAPADRTADGASTSDGPRSCPPWYAPQIPSWLSSDIPCPRRGRST